MYFIDKQEQVIGLLKMKACWYVLLRAAREKLKAAVAKMKKEIEKTGASSEEFVAALCRSVNKKVRTRFGQIAEWLSIADSTVEEWTALVQVSASKLPAAVPTPARPSPPLPSNPADELAASSPSV